MDDLRFPIGKFELPNTVSPVDRERCIAEIEATPRMLAAAVDGLTAEQLDIPYRPGGWTVRQVVHHVPDSHMNAYIRIRLALTEDEPLVKVYAEAAWANLSDARQGPVDVSLTLLAALHTRAVALMRALTSAEWARTFRHPERGLLRIDQTAAMYAWHGRHHVAHVTRLRERMGWR
jgi:hypothetical protein